MDFLARTTHRQPEGECHRGEKHEESGGNVGDGDGEHGLRVSVSSRARKGARLAGLALACLALLAGGCRTNGRPITLQKPGVVTTYDVVMDLNAPDVIQGYQDGYAHRLAFVARITEEQTLTRTVVAHEIGHALGCRHVYTAGAIMYPAHGPGEAPVETFTAEELAQAHRSDGCRISLRIDPACPPRIREAVTWAVDLWNTALGEPVLSVEKISLDSR